METFGNIVVTNHGIRSLAAIFNLIVSVKLLTDSSVTVLGEELIVVSDGGAWLS